MKGLGEIRRAWSRVHLYQQADSLAPTRQSVDLPPPIPCTRYPSLKNRASNVGTGFDSRLVEVSRQEPTPERQELMQCRQAGHCQGVMQLPGGANCS